MLAVVQEPWAAAADKQPPEEEVVASGAPYPAAQELVQSREEVDRR